MDFAKIFKDVKVEIIKKSPALLVGLGLSGMILTTVMAVKATPKALDILVDVKEKHKDDDDKKALAKDIVCKVVPVYVPAAIVGIVSSGCIIGASAINFRRNAALATAYTLSENALREYQSKVIDTIGPRKEKAIHDDISKDHVDQHPVSNTQVIVTGKGNTLFYDELTDRYFYFDLSKVATIELELNKRLMSYDYIGLDEVYYEFGLKCPRRRHDGNDDGYDLSDMGFNIKDGYFEIHQSPQLADDGQPCIALRFSKLGYRYGDLH